VIPPVNFIAEVWRTLMRTMGEAEPHRPNSVVNSIVKRGDDEEAMMGRGLLLWLLGVPIPVIILLWLFFGH
jgi:hypothetical protein